VSLSDPEARKMLFPDGAVGPAYNAQIVVTPNEGIIVSVEMTDRRNDAGVGRADGRRRSPPLRQDTGKPSGRYPLRATSEDIAALAAHAAGPVKVFAPPPTATTSARGRWPSARASGRGLIKAKAVALWHALANNLMAAHRLPIKAAQCVEPGPDCRIGVEVGLISAPSWPRRGCELKTHSRIRSFAGTSGRKYLANLRHYP
jgi:hypothetical protein